MITPPTSHTANIEYTETALSCIKRIASFLTQVNVEPKPILDAALKEFEARVSTFPESCQIAPQLLSIGCAKYSECNTKNGYRIIYSVSATLDEITCHAILRQKQDLQGLLFSRIIER